MTSTKWFRTTVTTKRGRRNSTLRVYELTRFRYVPRQFNFNRGLSIHNFDSALGQVMSQVTSNVDRLRKLAAAAGTEILKFHRAGNWSVRQKADSSPVTDADEASNAILIAGLEALNIAPVISEESDPESRSPSRMYWLVDPLDGTKDFVAGGDSFAICIGLVRDDYPIFGLVHAPVTGEVWWAVAGGGCWQGDQRRLANWPERPSIAVTSRSLLASDLSRGGLPPIADFKKLASALKFGRMVEGDFDLYPRFGQTGEWDTAAGQMLIEEMGGSVLDFGTGERLRYGKSNFMNSEGFVALRPGLGLKGR